MSRYTISPEKALVILKEVAKARVRWGKQVGPPYSMFQLMEAIELANAQKCFDPPAPPDHTHEEFVELRRQLGASKAREKLLQQKLKQSK